MAERLHSPAALLAVSSRAAKSRLPAGNLAPAPFRSQYWGNSQQLSLRHQQQQQQHCWKLKPYSFQVMNTAPWLRWWDKDGAPNMVEIHSMQEFLDALSDAGEKLVIVDFYARHCNGCRTLYPKLCKIAKEHPEVLFLKINYDENSEICKALNVKVLPLFFVYRAQGHLESFSCTISKIQRLRDAIAKYSEVSEKKAASPVSTVVGSLLAKAAGGGSSSSSASLSASSSSLQQQQQQPSEAVAF